MPNAGDGRRAPGGERSSAANDRWRRRRREIMAWPPRVGDDARDDEMRRARERDKARELTAAASRLDMAANARGIISTTPSCGDQRA